MKQFVTPARFRFVVQLSFTLFCTYVGIRFAAFLAWALGQSDTFVAKPGAVEGFLPISALLAVRQFFATGEWDTVHPAGLTIFLAIVVMAFIFRKGFCGYICPVGFVSNLLERAGRKMRLAKVPHKYIDYPLMSVKYLLTGFFLYTVFRSMSLHEVRTFLTAPYNMVADAKMLAFFTDPSTLSVGIIAGLVVFSLVVRNAWCRYLCPYGALLGLFAWVGPAAVSRDDQACIGCGKCTRGCPAGIEVEVKETVRSPECIGCAECIGNCPVEGCLSVSAWGKGRLPWFVLGVGAVAVLLGFYLWAKTTGHWDAEIPQFMYRRVYPMFMNITH